MVALLEKVARREGFGDVLADGVKRAAEQIGGDSEEFAVHFLGQEPAIMTRGSNPGGARLMPSMLHQAAILPASS